MLNRWASSCDKITSCDLRIKARTFVRMTSSDELRAAGEFSLRHRFSGDQWRVDILEENRGGKQFHVAEGEIVALACDGQKFRFFNSEENQGDIVEAGRINQMIIKAPLHQETYRRSFFGESYVENVRQRRKVTVKIEPSGLVELVGEKDPKARVSWMNLKFRATLDPHHDYLPTQLITFDAGEKTERPIFEYRNILFRQVIDGVWFPVDSVQDKYDFDAKSANPFVRQRTYIAVHVAQSTFNEVLDPDLFRMRFPPGTIVRDHIREQNYMAVENGSRDTQGYNDLIASMARNRREVHAVPNDTRKVWFILVNVCVILILSVMVFLRWRVRRLG